MDFTLDDADLAVAALAGRVLADHGGHDRAARIEDAAPAEAVDREAWLALGATGLLEAVCAGERSVVGASRIALAVGSEVVTLPAWALLAALDAVVGAGVLGGGAEARALAGEGLVTMGLHEVGVPDAARPRCEVVDGRIRGAKPVVPAAVGATGVVVSAAGR